MEILDKACPCPLLSRNTPHGALTFTRAFFRNASPSFILRCQAFPDRHIPVVSQLPTCAFRRRAAGPVHVAQRFPYDLGWLRHSRFDFRSNHSIANPGVPHQLSVVLDAGAGSGRLRQTPRCQKAHGKPSSAGGSGRLVPESVLLPVLQRIHSAGTPPCGPPLRGSQYATRLTHPHAIGCIMVLVDHALRPLCCAT
jgi:hypothetical protein